MFEPDPGCAAGWPDVPIKRCMEHPRIGMNLIEPLEARCLLSTTTIIPTTDPGSSRGTAFNLGTIKGTKAVQQEISPSDSDDYYKISIPKVPEATNFNVSLSGLSANADVQVIASNGDVLDNSTTAGTGKEVITRTLGQGVYYIRVMQATNDVSTAYTLTVNADLNWGNVKNGGHTKSVGLEFADGSTGPINPKKTTWLVLHGWQSDPVSVSSISGALEAHSPNAQVLVLDWSGPASEDLLSALSWVKPVGKWTAKKLTSLGLAGSKINIVGHSFGGFMADVVASNMNGGANRIVALDPATNPLAEVNYAAHSRYSLAFIGSSFSTADDAMTADATIRVKVGPYDSIFTHMNVATLFGNILASDNSATPDPISALFDPEKMTLKNKAPWKAGAYSGYDGVLTGKSSDLTEPGTFVYKNRVNGKVVKLHA